MIAKFIRDCCCCLVPMQQVQQIHLHRAIDHFSSDMNFTRLARDINLLAQRLGEGEDGHQFDFCDRERYLRMVGEEDGYPILRNAIRRAASEVPKVINKYQHSDIVYSGDKLALLANLQLYQERVAFTEVTAYVRRIY